MPFHTRLIWGIYTLLLTGTLSYRGMMLFSSNSPERIYYYLLFTFDNSYFWFYLSSIIQWILSCILLIPFLLNLRGQKLICQNFWQAIFLGAFFFNLTGHHYHLKSLQAIYHYDIYLGILSTIVSIMIYIPLYYFAFTYAFVWDWRKAERSCS